MPKEITIRKIFTRDELLVVRAGKVTPEYNVVNVGTYMMRRLTQAGIPVVGYFGVLAVEWGKLTITHDEGIDCDEWMFEWTGAPVPKDWPKTDATGQFIQLFRLDKPLAAAIAAEEDEL